MEVFVAGCIHGDWEMVVDEVNKLRDEGKDIQLVLINGDCETFRTLSDINSFAKKEEKMKKGKKPEDIFGTFYKLYTGEKRAPCLFVLIGGNKECVDLLASLPFGGFIAPNVYYTGRATIIDYKGIRISALGGNYSFKSYNQPLNIKIPVTDVQLLKNAQHIRSYNLYQLLLYKNLPQYPNMHFIMSHEWPLHLPRQHKDEAPFTDERYKELIHYYGIPLPNPLIDTLKPEYWTAAHLHIPFKTTITTYKHNTTKFVANPRPKDLKKNGFPWYTLITIPRENLNVETISRELSYAPEWIAILQATNDNTKYKSVKCEGRGGKTYYDWNIPILRTQTEVFEKLGPIQEWDPSMLLINQDCSNPDAHTEELCHKYTITRPK